MPLLAVLTIILAITVLGLIILASRHKKSATGPIKLLGSVGVVHTTMSPEGTVLVDGELWRAASPSLIQPQARVRVVGAREHLLLVESE